MALAHSSPATNVVTLAVVAATPVLWMNTTLAAVGSLFTIIWMGIQITVSIKSYLDKRELARGPRGPKGDPGETKVAVVPVPVVIKDVPK